MTSRAARSRQISRRRWLAELRAFVSSAVDRVRFNVVLLFLPSMAVVSVAYGIAYSAAEQRFHTNLNSNAGHTVTSYAAAVRRSLGLLGRDILFLERDDVFQTAIAGGTERDLDVLAAEWVRFVRTKSDYNMVRWLDETGMERVRVDYRDGVATVLRPENLQFKGGRYYFTESHLLNPSGIYFSRLDLNIENGRIERPFLPTIRVATPVFDKTETRRGIVILNYDATDMVHATPALEMGALWLLNADGFWLRGDEPETEWGFMFGRTDDSAAVRFPDEWRRIQSTETGGFLASSGWWSFETVHPKREGRRTSLFHDTGYAGGDVGAPNDGAPLKVVAFIPRADYIEDLTFLRLGYALSYLVLLGCAYLVAYWFVRSNKESLAAVKAKSAFLSNMSHEIRTPMNAILGYAYLLERQDLSPSAKSMAERISFAGNGLLVLINDILDFSKIEANKITLEHVPFLLEDLMEQVGTVLSVGIGDKPVDCVVSPIPEGAEMLKGDPTRLGQILNNLAGNAAKFTSSGEIVVDVRCVDSVENASTVNLRFLVRDTGIGIPEDRREAIFSPFEQADNSTTRTHGGTGLGLTITKNLVSMMGGELSVESVVGEGSTFAFNLAFETMHTEDNVLPALLYKRILIVSAQETGRSMLVQTAGAIGWLPHSARSAAEATALCRKSSFDVILVDTAFPDGSDVAAARPVCDAANDDAILILLTSAHERERLPKDPADMGADFILVKPITGSGLFNAVAEVLSARGDLARAEGRSDLPRLSGLRVLVVDDSVINRDIACEVLEREGADTVTCANGEEALTALFADVVGFDAVLMDVQMPVMNGYDATRAIRESSALRSLPVIAVTAGAFAEHRDAAAHAGMDAFIAKPFNVTELVTTILTLVGPDDGD